MSSREHDRAELSCNSCRERKIRCNRARPCCDKCQTLDVSCVFPSRKQRSKRTMNSTEDALKNIFDRLGQLERTVASMQQPELRAGTRIRGVDRLEKDGSNEPEYDKYDNPTISSRGDDSLLFKGSESSKSATSSPPESIILRAPLSHVVERSRTQTICPSLTKVEESVSIPCTPSLTELVSEATKLARAMLTEKVPETKHQQCLENLDRVVTETVDAVNIKLYCHPEQQQFLMPSKEDSKKWLKLFFSTCPEHLIFSAQPIVPREFLQMIPDLLDNPSVTLTSSSLIMFYSFCHQGLSLDESEIPLRAAYSRGLYCACLKLLEPWRSQTGPRTTIDIGAAVTMTLTSGRFLDNNLAWSIFNYGCEIAKSLGFFDIDNPDYVHDLPMTPERRLVSRLQFWQLYQFDSAFSLQAGKATSIPDGSYMVEAPSLIPWKVKTRVSPQHQVIFFTLTRLAQVQRKISQLFGVRGHARTGFESRVLEGTLDTLVKEVTRILDESQLVERYRTATGNMQWYYGDILFNVHTTMTLLYRAESHGGAVPAPALLNARAAINLMKELYTKFPRGRHWNIGFVCFYPFIPYFTLFCNLLATVDADVTSARADLTLTEWLQSTIQEISQDREGLDRFAGILKRLNTVAEYFVRMKEGPASDGTAMGTEMDVEVHMLMGEELSMGDFDFSLDEFLLSPVEYARMLETVVVSGDAHQEWWNGNESMRM